MPSQESDTAEVLKLITFEAPVPLPPVIVRRVSYKKKLSVVITTPTEEEKSSNLPYMSRYNPGNSALSISAEVEAEAEVEADKEEDLGSPSYLKARKRSLSRSKFAMTTRNRNTQDLSQFNFNRMKKESFKMVQTPKK